MNGASGENVRAASSMFSVPVALTPKSVNGSFAAQSWDGCAAVWITALIDDPNSANTPDTAFASRMSTLRCV